VGRLLLVVWLTVPLLFFSKDKAQVGPLVDRKGRTAKNGAH
jgi:hypothetical protein